MVDTPRQTEDRHRLYRLLEVGRRQLQMDEDTFRQLLARHGAKERNGHPSRHTMSVPELDAAVREMRHKGFKPRPPRANGKVIDWRQARIAKITAIWCALADVGVVHNRSEQAMIRWCAGVTKVARLQWASSKTLNDCIEALKSWAAREGVPLDG